MLRLAARSSIAFRIAALSAALALHAAADVVLPPVFGDHMVLQRDRDIPVWGTAAPGERVVVTLAGQALATTADEDGRWRVRLEPLEAASDPLELEVVGRNSIVLSDVLVGEVWFCAGQSNMGSRLEYDPSAKVELPAANHPRLRLLRLTHPMIRGWGPIAEGLLERLEPANYDEYPGWVACTPETAADFSAVSYFFGSRILEELDVPVGLVLNAVGGSPTEAWVSRSSIAANPALLPILEHHPANDRVHPNCRQTIENMLQWLATSAGEGATARHPFTPGYLFEASILPLAPYALRGVLWYQGESNAHAPGLHEELFATLVADWRRVWEQGEFPFLFVQVSGTEDGHPSERWPEFRDGQRASLAITNTGMAVSMDLGFPKNVHIRDTRTVGFRLARWALAVTYGRGGVASGPLYRSMERRGREIALAFDHTGSGLASRGGELVGFEVCGPDGVFHSALGKIAADRVLVSSPLVAEPRHARYAWRPFSTANLINVEGLPASTFTTDR